MDEATSEDLAFPSLLGGNPTESGPRTVWARHKYIGRC